MPPRAQRVDPNQPVPGSDADVTEIHAAAATTPEAEQNSEASRLPEQGKTVHLRGEVSREAGRIGHRRNKPFVRFRVTGALYDASTGKDLSEPREWLVSVDGVQAEAVKDGPDYKVGRPATVIGSWRPTYEGTDGSDVTNEIRSYSVFPTYGPSLSRGAEAAPSVADRTMGLRAAPAAGDGGMGGVAG